MPKPFVIAIDGGAGSGKSTLAKRLATRFGFQHLNTGLLYRAVGLAAQRQGLQMGDEAAITALARQMALVGLDTGLDNADLTGKLAGEWANGINQYQGVRRALRTYQVDFPAGKAGAVMEGRDMKTLFPLAPVKIFVTANAEIRAQRRLKELQSRDSSVTYEAVLADVRTRDERDAYNIGTIAPDAFVLDTSALDADQTEAAAATYIQTKLG